MFLPTLCHKSTKCWHNPNLASSGVERYDIQQNRSSLGLGLGLGLVLGLGFGLGIGLGLEFETGLGLGFETGLGLLFQGQSLHTL